MFNFNDLNTIQIEITSNCQASCPMCARNYRGNLPNPKLKLNDWTLQDFNKIFNNDVLNQIKTITFCGSLGDPLMNNDLLSMVKLITNQHINIHTNGSIRSTSYWAELAKALPKKHKVVFGIDGLTDTHHLYRIGTNFEKIINNAKSFIENGGTAEWVYIVFKHNAHQIELAKKLAKDIGFSSFITKNSVRFTDENFNVYDKNGKTLYQLEPPNDNILSFVNKDTIQNFDEWFNNTEPSCQVLKTKEIYIDFQKIMYPCCWIASSFYLYTKPNDILHPYILRINKECDQLISDLGGYDFLSLDKNTIKNIINSKVWQTIYENKWKNKDLLICSKNCGVSKVRQISITPNQIINYETL